MFFKKNNNTSIPEISSTFSIPTLPPIPLQRILQPNRHRETPRVRSDWARNLWNRRRLDLELSSSENVGRFKNVKTPEKPWN